MNVLRALLICTLALVAASTACIVPRPQNFASIDEGDARESALPTSSVLQKFNPLVPDSVNGYPVPKEINGYPVVFVQTSDRIPWLRPGEVVLVLLGPPTLEEVISNVSLAEFAKTLPEGWTIKIVGGRGFSLEKMLNYLQELIEGHQEYGPVHSGGPGPVGTQAPEDHQKYGPIRSGGPGAADTQ